MEEVGKKNNVLVVILLLLLIASCGFIVYDKFLKKEGSTNSSGSNVQDTMSNELAIALVKEKLDIANKYLNDSTRYRGEQYSEEGEGSLFYEYKSLDEFKKEFYSIYSSKLSYKDVLGEQKLPFNKKNAIDGVSTNLTIDPETDQLPMHSYAIKNNTVYITGCTSSGSDFKRMGDFSVDSITNGTIKVNYAIYEYSVGKGISDDEVKTGDGKITLVKENGEWRILNAMAAAGLCGGVYKVGK